MRRHTKASFAGSNSGQGISLGSVRRAFTTRGAFSDVDASGAFAPAAGTFGFGRRHRGSRTLVALLCVSVCVGAMAVVSVSSAQAGKAVVKVMGSPSAGTLGGFFSTPRGIAVNASGAGAADPGDFYVVDSGNHRIQQFNADGVFIRAFGQDTIASTVNEQQAVRVKATGGTYTLSFNGESTSPIAFNANAEAIDDALDVLLAIGGDANVVVVGSVFDGFTVTFQGSLAAADQPQLIADASSLGGQVSISTLADGTPTTASTGTGFERCEVMGHCKAGITAPPTGGAFNAPQGIAIDQSNGSVYVTDQGNRRVQKFSADGTFDRAFGWDVLIGGVTTFEVCTVAAECKIGTSGAGAGQFAAAIGHPAVVPPGAANAGDVLVADPTNRRVQRFEGDGDFLYAFGWDVDPAGAVGQLEKCTVTCRAGTPAGAAVGQFPTNFPTRVAVDSSNVVYTLEASSISSSFRVQRFNALVTSASIFAPAHLNGDFNTPPSDIQVNPTNDQVYVTKATGAPVERRILQFDASGTLLDTHAVGAGLPSTNGLGLNGSMGRLYLSSGSTFNPRIFILDNPALPAVTLDPVATFDETSATFTGNVDPNGLSATYRFEYLTEAAWQANPAAERFAGATRAPTPDAGPIDSSSAVQENVLNLEPNTTYKVRLVATKTFAAGTAESAVQTFTTPATGPRIVSIGTFPGGSETSAILFATIDPEGQPTDFHFQFGTSTAYGQSSPIQAVGSSGAEKVMFFRVDGLNPDTTYHFKAIASNSTGTIESADASFATATSQPCANEPMRTGSAAHLPDCRAYEMVSPVDKNGGDIETAEQEAGVGSHLSSAYRQASDTGGKLTYSSATAFGNAIGGHFSNQYLATRGPQGWSSHSISSRRGTTVLEQEIFDLRWYTYGFFQGFTTDLSSAWIRDDNENPLAAGALEDYVNLYRRDNNVASYQPLTTQGPFGPNRLISLSLDETSLTGGPRVAGASTDLRHQVLAASAALTPNAIQTQFGSELGTPLQLYDKLAEPTNAVQRLTLNATSGTYTLGAEAVRGTGMLTIGSPNVTAVEVESPDRGYQVGDIVEGAGISPGTTVLAVGEGTLTLSQSATQSGLRAIVAVEKTDPPLSATASAEVVENALEALPAIGAGNVSVSGGPGDASGTTPYRISFTGVLAGEPIFALRPTDLGLSGGVPVSSAAVAISDPGGDVHLLSVLPNGSAASTHSFAGTLGSPKAYETHYHMLKNAVADDGSRVFWSATRLSRGPGKIYVRENPGEEQSTFTDGAASGTGTLTAGSTGVTGVTTSSGAFAVGQTIDRVAEDGIPLGATITAVGPGSLTLSVPATRNAAGAGLESYSDCAEPTKACTVHIAGADDGGGPQEQGRAQFWAASADGEKVLFSVGRHPERIVKLFDVDSKTTVTIAGESPGVSATSEDLSDVFLTSKEDLADGATAGELNLYHYRDGAYVFIGGLSEDDFTRRFQTISGNDIHSGTMVGVGPDQMPLPVLNQTRISADGSYFTFMSNDRELSEVTAGYDNRDLVTGKPDFEVYRYDAVAEDLSCASCNPSGIRPRGALLRAPYSPLSLAFTNNPDARAAASIPTHEQDLHASRIISDDGSRLFFHSDEALLPRDTNGVQDVYQWQAPGAGQCDVDDPDYFDQNEGCIYLISSGTDAAKSEFVDASASGDEVFVSTDESLDPRDPALRDIYVVKVGGGFPLPQPLTACEGEACQSPPAPPNDPAPGSSSFQGAGNVNEGKPRPRCPKGKRKVRRNGKVRCVPRKRAGKSKKHSRTANNDRRASR